MDLIPFQDDAKGLGLCEAQVKTRYYLIEEDGNHHWLTPGNQSIQHETVKDAMHMDGSVVIGVDFKYLPPTRLLCNDENVEMRLMSGPASMLSRATTTAAKEEHEKEITIDGGGVIEQAGGGSGVVGEEDMSQVPVAPPNTPNNGQVSPIPAFSQVSCYCWIGRKSDCYGLRVPFRRRRVTRTARSSRRGIWTSWLDSSASSLSRLSSSRLPVMATSSSRGRSVPIRLRVAGASRVAARSPTRREGGGSSPRGAVRSSEHCRRRQSREGEVSGLW